MYQLMVNGELRLVWVTVWSDQIGGKNLYCSVVASLSKAEVNWSIDSLSMFLLLRLGNRVGCC